MRKTENIDYGTDAFVVKYHSSEKKSYFMDRGVFVTRVLRKEWYEIKKEKYLGQELAFKKKIDAEKKIDGLQKTAWEIHTHNS